MTDASTPAHLEKLQRTAFGLLAFVAGFTVVTLAVLEPSEGPRWLATLAALIGAVSPVAAARLRERAVDSAGDGDGSLDDWFERATMVALGLGEGGAFVAIIGWILTGEPLAWVGVATCVLVFGAFWPTEARRESFDQRVGELRRTRVGA